MHIIVYRSIYKNSDYMFVYKSGPECVRSFHYGHYWVETQVCLPLILPRIVFVVLTHFYLLLIFLIHITYICTVTYKQLSIYDIASGLCKYTIATYPRVMIIYYIDLCPTIVSEVFGKPKSFLTGSKLLENKKCPFIKRYACIHISLYIWRANKYSLLFKNEKIQL